MIHIPNSVRRGQTLHKIDLAACASELISPLSSVFLVSGLGRCSPVAIMKGEQEFQEVVEKQGRFGENPM
jgi:hypothetical protein